MPVAGARYAIQQIPAAPGPPVAGYIAWYDAADTATITASSNAVSQWNDKGSHNIAMTQATGANQPLTNTSTINGKNVLSFDATNDVLNSASSWASGGTVTAFAVYKLNNTTAKRRDIVNGGSVGFFAGVINNTHFEWFDNAARNLGNIDTIAHVHTGSSSAANGDRGWLDGALITSAGFGGQSFGSTSFGNAAGLLDGLLAEVVVYASDLSTTDRQSVEAYLRAKWATP